LQYCFANLGDPLDFVTKEYNGNLNAESVLIGVADDDGSCATNAIPGKIL